MEKMKKRKKRMAIKIKEYLKNDTTSIIKQMGTVLQ